MAGMTKSLVALTLVAIAAPAAAQNWNNDDRRDRQTASPREVQRSWERVQDERQDLNRAWRQGDRDDVREERRELRRAEKELRRDARDLDRSRWNGGWNNWERGGWNNGDRGQWNNGNIQYRGWSGQDRRWGRDDWRHQGWPADRFYRQGNYRPRYLGYNDQIWGGYDGRYYCRRSDGTTGLIVGGIAGGVLGSALSPGRNTTLGALIGGGLGAVIGSSIDRDRIVCR